MSISLITNFKVNSNTPIDTRLVATGPDGLTNMEYKYEGLTVYRTDTGYSYIWDGTTWNLISNGIYGGSGSIVGDTVIDQGFVGTTIGDTSNELILSASASEEIINFSSKFIRNDSDDVEFKHSLSFGTASGPYITFNPAKLETTLTRGGISIGTGDDVDYIVSERIRIENHGLIRLKPTNTLTASLNVYYVDDSITFGYNWNSVKENSEIGSSFLKFSNQILSINHIGTNSNISTHSVIFYNSDNLYAMEVNGNMTTKNIILGDGNGNYSVNYGGLGFGLDKTNEEVSLFNNGSIKSIIFLIEIV